MLDSTITGKAISEARKKRGLTQDQLADSLHVSKQAISNWERGKNLPDEGIRERIEEELGIKLQNENKKKTLGTSIDKLTFDIKPLGEIETLEEITHSVNTIIDAIEIDEYRHVVNKMLYMTIISLLGYEIYYEDHCTDFYCECPLDWYATAEELELLIDDGDEWITKNSHYPFRHFSNILKKLKQIAFNIGGELFEDFDDNGYRDNYVQQIGKLGQKCSEKLMTILPDYNTDIMVIYRTAIYDIIDILAVLCPNE